MSKLYRSSRNKMVTGLCGGLSDVLGIDATLLRILVLIGIFFSAGTILFIYFIASLVIPKEYVPPFNQFGNGNPGHGNHGYGAGGHNNGGPYNNNGGSYNNNGSGSEYKNSNPGGFSSHASDLDDMMKDIEKKALKKEVEELKIKLSKYEKGEV
ncbi:PspC domain-containing protein [Paenibacillus sp. FA6]|uniref:PspC domain-containing protein n=1 Tax=Paenibacillus sp. FA6 TaxID=3413029 RepID=UPI003F65C94D